MNNTNGPIIEAQPLINNSRRGSYLNFILRNFYLILRFIFGLVWIVLGTILFIQNYNKHCKYELEYCPLIIVFNCILKIYDIFMDLKMNLTLGRYNPKSKIKRIYNLIDLIMLMYFIFFNETCDGASKYVYICLYTYLFFEYVLMIFIFLVALCIIKCGSIFCLHNIIISNINNNIPLRLGASDEELQNLNYYKYNDGQIKSIKINKIIKTNKIIKINNEDSNCIICLEQYMNNDSLILLPCKHHFHEECLHDWLKINKSCPVCRGDPNFS